MDTACVLRAECAISCPPPPSIILTKLVQEDVCHGGNDLGAVLTLPELPQELKVNAHKVLQLREEALQEVRLEVKVVLKSLLEDLLHHFQKLTDVLLRHDELVDVLLPLDEA